MATEKQLQAVAKMQEAKRRKAEERERLKMQQEESKNIHEEEEEEEDFDDSGEMEHNEKENTKREIKENNDLETGLKIDAELKSLYDSNNREISARDLKSQAPKTYNVIFENYEEGEENGIETSYYRLIEKENQVYSISKI